MRQSAPIWRHFATDQDGGVAILFAVMLTIICGGAAVALDLGRAFSIKSKLQSDVDAAVLAGAATSGTDAQRIALANRYIDEALKKNKIDGSVVERRVTPTGSPGIQTLGGGINAVVSVRLNSYFAGVIGYGTMDVGVTSKASKVNSARVLDIAMCIDATGSMQPTIDAVKSNALSFYNNLNQEFERRGVDKFSAVRIRPIFFRDFGGNYKYDVASGGQVDKYPNGWVNRPAGDARNYGDDVPMRASPDFFNMVNQSSDLSTFVNPEVESGGGDNPESGLECLNEAMESKWLKKGHDILTDQGKQKADEVFSVIAIWTDQDVHPPGFARSLLNPNYPPAGKMPRDYAGLAAKWTSEATIPQQNKLLSMFLPGVAPVTNWQPVMDWDRFTRAGTLTDGTSQMVSSIVDAVTQIAKPGGVAKLVN